ncbi:MAG: hypothetical protein Q7S39_00805, partial [Ignavibacteria bacterium]|nr:hypothetical protein [Ignavibacteria bacterium]
MLSKTTCPDSIGKSRLSADLPRRQAGKAGFAGKILFLSLIIIAVSFAQEIVELKLPNSNKVV